MSFFINDICLFYRFTILYNKLKDFVGAEYSKRPEIFFLRILV